MALSDHNILIIPNIGQTDDPKIVFSGADASTTAQDIIVKVYPTDNGTLSFEGSVGQLFSITNSLSGTLFSVNDISGIPSIEVIDTGLIKLAQYSGNVVLGSGTDTVNAKLQVTGNVRVTGEVTAGYSDERLKDFHGTISNALDKISQLNGYYFTENETAKKLGYINDNMQVGLSAQEVEQVLPEIVTEALIENNLGYKTVKYDKMIPLLVEAIKEQQSMIKLLETKLNNLGI